MADQDAIQSKRSVDIRRSERVFLRVPILVRGQAENDSSLSEESHTLVVNARMPSHHVGDQHASKNEVAIAFTQPAPHFWPIDFPPSD